MIKLDFIRSYFTGETGFSTIEWRTLLADKIMTAADEIDISNKLVFISKHV